MGRGGKNECDLILVTEMGNSVISLRVEKLYLMNRPVFLQTIFLSILHRNRNDLNEFCNDKNERY